MMSEFWLLSVFIYIRQFPFVHVVTLRVNDFLPGLRVLFCVCFLVVVVVAVVDVMWFVVASPLVCVTN